MASKEKKTKSGGRKRKRVEPASRGLSPLETRGENPPAEMARLRAQVEADGGMPLGLYRDPLGGHWQLLAALPLSRVKPTAFQRNLSEAHVKRLTEKIGRLDRFLDPIIAVRTGEDGGIYLTPNGFHRASAMEKLGAKAIIALVIPEMKIAYQILALNTEKAHNVREKSLEAIRMARELARLDPGQSEALFESEFEEAPFLTLGACYEKKGNFSGGAYYPVLKRVDGFLDEKLPRALSLRERRAEQVFGLDGAVNKVVDALRARGLKSPYLKNFVVARINPLRFRRGASAEFDGTFAAMLEACENFDIGKVRADQVAGAMGPVEN